MRFRPLALALAFALAFPALAFATCTQTQVSSSRSKLACTTGTEPAPTLSTQGQSLVGLKGVSVTVEADSGQTLSGAGTLQAYTWDPVAAGWARNPDLDLPVTVSAARRQSFLGIWVPAPTGRIAYAPNGVTVSAGGVTVYTTGVAGTP